MKVARKKAKTKTPRVMKVLGMLLLAAIIYDIRSAGSFYGELNKTYSFHCGTVVTLMYTHVILMLLSHSNWPCSVMLCPCFCCTEKLQKFILGLLFPGSRVGQTVERLGLVPYLEAFGRASKNAFIQSYR